MIYIRNGKRFNIYASGQIDGVFYPYFTDPDIQQKLGITTAPEPDQPEDFSYDTYYRTEQDDAPYVVYIKKSDEQILEVMQSKFLAAVQSHLDSGAKEAGYDNIVSACSYAGAPNPFQAESQSFISWRGEVWSYCYQELAKVTSGERPIPVLEDFLLELPERVTEV